MGFSFLYPRAPLVREGETERRRIPNLSLELKDSSLTNSRIRLLLIRAGCSVHFSVQITFLG